MWWIKVWTSVPHLFLCILRQGAVHPSFVRRKIFPSPNLGLGHVTCFGQRQTGKNDSIQVLNMDLRRLHVTPLVWHHCGRRALCWLAAGLRMLLVPTHSCTWKHSYSAEGSIEQAPPTESQIHEKHPFIFACCWDLGCTIYGGSSWLAHWGTHFPRYTGS